jgi:hypothetical protein
VQRGILPISESHFDVFGDWQLPGHGEAYGDCGSWRYRGCLHVEDHLNDGLFESIAGKAYIEFYKRSCLRAACPVCYEKWAGKEAGKIEYRLASVGRKMGRVIHVTVSPRMDDWAMPYEKLRAKAYSISKKSGFRGGSCIFHPFREDDNGFWYFSPHFHLIGYGWITGTKKGFESHGWVVRNLRVRESVSGTALYQLSHCGIRKGTLSVTWFGKLSFNKLRIPPKEPEKHVCPACHRELVQLYFLGRDEQLPDKEEGLGFWSEADLWMQKRSGLDG